MALTNGGYLLAQGYTFDIEDSRTTNRLHVAHGIMRSLGYTAEIVHDEEWHKRFEEPFGPQSRNCMSTKCVNRWNGGNPSHDIFNAAYDLADTFIVHRARSLR